MEPELLLTHSLRATSVWVAFGSLLPNWDYTSVNFGIIQINMAVIMVAIKTSIKIG